MSGFRKGPAKVEVALKWDPAPAGRPPHDLDLVAATYAADDPHGEPVYVVHFGSRSPDGTITLDRDSRTGQGFGFDEVMTVELDRIRPELGRVVVGVSVQDQGGRVTFGEIANAGFRIREGHTVLAEGGFAEVGDCPAVLVAEFVRDGAGAWTFVPGLRGSQSGPAEFVRAMGALRTR
ncbi:TerD family protein [Streptomyces sp. NPDC086023]|uniref:TerD family protein n=1 Tax=Streptomyces sp. NPDC086023 TaxID=3365746 RepID=UPI0037CE4254